MITANSWPTCTRGIIVKWPVRRKKCPWRYIRVCDLEHRKVSVVCTSGLFLAERICKFSIEADESVRVLRYVRVSVKWGFHSTAKDLELIPLYTT